MELGNRGPDAVWISLDDPRLGFRRCVHSGPLDMLVDHVQENEIRIVACRERSAQTWFDGKLVSADGRDPAEEGDPLSCQLTKIDRMSAVCASDQRQRLVGSALGCRC